MKDLFRLSQLQQELAKNNEVATGFYSTTDFNKVHELIDTGWDLVESKVEKVIRYTLIQHESRGTEEKNCHITCE